MSQLSAVNRTVSRMSEDYQERNRDQWINTQCLVP